MQNAFENTVCEMTDIFFRGDKLKILHISKRMKEDKKTHETNTAPGVSSSSSLCCIQLLIQHTCLWGLHSQRQTNWFCMCRSMCYNYDMWATWRLKLLLIRLFVQRPVPIRANIKENIKYAGPLSRCSILLTFTTRNADSASWAAMQYHSSITME